MNNDRDASTDEALAVSAAQGDRAAFDVLIGRHKDALYRFARRYVGQADDAYDVLQDSFVSAWLALDRYDPARPFSPWLHRIVLNKCRDLGRRQIVRRTLLRLFSKEVAETVEPSAAVESDLQNSRLQKLDQAVAALPSQYKEPLLLTMMDGMSHEEAAAILKISAKAVEMRLYRARQQLREALDQPPS